MFLAFFFESYWISTQPVYIRINHGAMIFMYLRKNTCAVAVIHETCCELAMQLRRLSRLLVHAAGDVANASSWDRARRRSTLFDKPIVRRRTANPSLGELECSTVTGRSNVRKHEGRRG